VRRIIAFNLVTLDGYFEGSKSDISWHKVDAETDRFAVAMLKSADTLLFGRVTYDLMASFWPTPQASRNSPRLAAGMNSARKIVFSRTLARAEWNNTRLVKGDIEGEAIELKRQPGKDLALLGSGSVITQLAQRGLIDEYQIMVCPVALGEGTPLFKGIKERLDLRLTTTRTFKNGNVLLCYEPAQMA
jgi:dihydrofolate reductase